MGKCSFCGSESIKVKTPYVQQGGKIGEYESTYDYCCLAQKRNAKYIENRFDVSRGKPPTAEEVSIW